MIHMSFSVGQHEVLELRMMHNRNDFFRDTSLTDTRNGSRSEQG